MTSANKLRNGSWPHRAQSQKVEMRVGFHKPVHFPHAVSRGFLEAHEYVRLLQACIQSKSLLHGKNLHQHLIKNFTHIRNTTVLDKLTHFYIICGKIELARHVFDIIPTPSVVLWNLMIRAYAWNGPVEWAIDLYHKMLKSGVRPTKYTFPFVLKACSSLKALEEGTDIHNYAQELGLVSDSYVCTALVDLYAKCGRLEEAHRVFEAASYRDVITWNAMIAGYSLHGLYDSMMALVIQMQAAGKSPNSSTMVAILPTVAQANALCHGKAIHGYCTRRAFDCDVVLGTAFLDMYAKCQCLLYARRVFNSMGTKNEVACSAMIGAYVTCNSSREALELYDELVLKYTINYLTPVMLGNSLRACAKLIDQSRGRKLHCHSIKAGFVSDIMISNTLLSMYAKCGNLNDAMLFFNEMNLKDTVSYGAIISGCVQNGNAEEALFIFHTMQLSGIDPDFATMLGVLPACSHLAALKHGFCAHGYLIVRGFVTDTLVSNALIDMYTKCGEISAAREVFNRMHKRDVFTWNVMIVGYGIHGLGREAIMLFNEMQAAGLQPDDVTFISLLSACSHAGLVMEGKHYFDVMHQKFSIVPRMEHYICLVDLLGRAGFLDEANNFIRSMPFEPDTRIRSALLSACRIHKNIELGQIVSAQIRSVGTEITESLVLLSNIYCDAGRWNDAANVRSMQRVWGFTKSPGCSWVEINGTVHAFLGGDQFHPLSERIKEKLEELLAEIKQLGYRAESSFVLQDVEEEEKERVLLYHSEKLAIAFAILYSSPHKPILVTKNLRVCGDCHTAIKLFTTVTSRKITVRDANRFHHFQEGSCSCGDFW